MILAFALACAFAPCEAPELPPLSPEAINLPLPDSYYVNQPWDYTHEADFLLDNETRRPESGYTPQAFTGMGDNVEQWRPLVAGHFGDLGPGAVNIALCLMERESGGNPNATNRSSGASGLMQVMPSWAPRFDVSRNDLYKPEINLFIARKLYDDGGWGHWSPWNRGACH